jgi:hypothetical protein
MQTLLCVSEEEVVETPKNSMFSCSMKVRTAKRDYFRIDKKAAEQNRFA